MVDKIKKFIRYTNNTQRFVVILFMSHIMFGDMLVLEFFGKYDRLLGYFNTDETNRIYYGILFFLFVSFFIFHQSEKD